MELFVASCGIGPLTHVLLVEDDANDQTLFCLAARKSCLNLWVEGVLNGQEAVEYLESRPECADAGLDGLPQVVVLDLNMPEKDGFEFLRWCKSSPRFCRLPVVVMSGELRGAWELQAEALGTTRSFEKPFELGDFVQKIHEIWEVARVNAMCAGVRACGIAEQQGHGVRLERAEQVSYSE